MKRRSNALGRLLALVMVMSLFTPTALAGPAQVSQTGSTEGYNAQLQTFDGKQILSRTELSSPYTDAQLFALAEAGILMQSSPVSVSTRQTVSEDGLFVDDVVRIERIAEQMVLADGTSVEKVIISERATRSTYPEEAVGNKAKSGVVRVYCRLDAYYIDLSNGSRAARPIGYYGKAEKLNSNVTFSNLFMRCLVSLASAYTADGQWVSSANGVERNRNIVNPANNVFYDGNPNFSHYYGGTTVWCIENINTIYYTQGGSSGSFTHSVKLGP